MALSDLPSDTPSFSEKREQDTHESLEEKDEEMNPSSDKSSEPVITDGAPEDVDADDNEEGVGLLENSSIDNSQLSSDVKLSSSAVFPGRDSAELEDEIGRPVKLKTTSPREAQKLKDDAQTFAGTLAKEGTKFLPLAGMRLVENVAHLADVDSWDDQLKEFISWTQGLAGVSSEDQAFQQADIDAGDVGNRITRSMKEWREGLNSVDALETHSSPNTIFNPYDPTDYVTSLSEVGQSVVAFGGISGGLRATVGKGLAALASSMGGSQKVVQGAQIASQLASGYALANAEGSSEAMRQIPKIFEKAKQAHLEQGKSPKEARRLAKAAASKKAARIAGLNTALVGTLNFTGLTPLFRSPKVIKRMSKLGLTKKQGESLKETIERVEGMGYSLPAKDWMVRQAKEPLQEAAEEATNVFAQAEGKADQTSFSKAGQRFIDNVFTGEGAYAAAMGAMGGKMQDMTVRGLPIHERPEAIQKAIENGEIDAQDSSQGKIGAIANWVAEKSGVSTDLTGDRVSAKTLQTEQEIYDFNRKKEHFIERANELKEGRKMINEGANENDTSKILEGRRKIMSATILGSIQAGVEGQMKRIAQDWKDMDNQEADEKHNFETDEDSDFHYEDTIDDYIDLVDELSQKKEDIESDMRQSPEEAGGRMAEKAWRLYGSARLIDPTLEELSQEEQDLIESFEKLPGEDEATINQTDPETVKENMKSEMESLVQLRQEALAGALQNIVDKRRGEDSDREVEEPLPKDEEQVVSEADIDSVMEALRQRGRKEGLIGEDGRFTEEQFNEFMRSGVEKELKTLTQSSRFRGPKELMNQAKQQAESETQMESIPNAVIKMDPENRASFRTTRMRKETLRRQKERLYEDYKAYRDPEKRADMLKRMEKEQARKIQERAQEGRQKVEEEETAEDAQEAANDLSPNESTIVNQEAQSAAEEKKTEERKERKREREATAEDASSVDENSGDQESTNELVNPLADAAEDMLDEQRDEDTTIEEATTEATTDEDSSAEEDGSEDFNPLAEAAKSEQELQQIRNELEETFAQIRSNEDFDKETKKENVEKAARAKVKGRPFDYTEVEDLVVSEKNDIEENDLKDATDTESPTEIDEPPQTPQEDFQETKNETAEGTQDEHSRKKLVQSGTALAYASKETEEGDRTTPVSNDRSEGLNPLVETEEFGEGSRVTFHVTDPRIEEDIDLDSVEDIGDIEIEVRHDGELVGYVHELDFIRPETTVAQTENVEDNIQRQQEENLQLRAKIIGQAKQQDNPQDGIPGRVSGKRGGHVSVHYRETETEDGETVLEKDEDGNLIRDMRPLEEAVPALVDQDRNLENADFQIYVIRNGEPRIRGQQKPDEELVNDFNQEGQFLEGSVGIILPSANGDKVAVPVEVPKLQDVDIGGVPAANFLLGMIKQGKIEEIQKLAFTTIADPRRFFQRKDIKGDRTYLIASNDGTGVYIGSQQGGLYTNNPDLIEDEDSRYESIQGNENEVRRLLNNMWLNVNLEEINRSEDVSGLGSFEVAGTEYDSYNQFLAQHLRTDVHEETTETGEGQEVGRYFEQPTVTLTLGAEGVESIPIDNDSFPERQSDDQPRGDKETSDSEVVNVREETQSPVMPNVYDDGDGAALDSAFQTLLQTASTLETLSEGDVAFLNALEERLQEEYGIDRDVSAVIAEADVEDTAEDADQQEQQDAEDGEEDAEDADSEPAITEEGPSLADLSGPMFEAVMEQFTSRTTKGEQANLLEEMSEADEDIRNDLRTFLKDKYDYPSSYNDEQTVSKLRQESGETTSEGSDVEAQADEELTRKVDEKTDDPVVDDIFSTRPASGSSESASEPALASVGETIIGESNYEISAPAQDDRFTLRCER